jgi:hypothetical protein
MQAAAKQGEEFVEERAKDLVAEKACQEPFPVREGKPQLHALVCHPLFWEGQNSWRYQDYEM